MIHDLVAKLKNRCSCRFPAAMFVPLKALHNQLLKFGKTLFSHMKNRTDLIIGGYFSIFVFFHFPDSTLI